MRSYGIVYDCKLMEIRRAFFAVWMGCGALFFCGGAIFRHGSKMQKIINIIR